MFRKTTRLVSILTAVLLIFGLLSGCGAAKEPAATASPDAAVASPSAAATPAATPAVTDAKKKVIGLCLKYRGDEYYKDTEVTFVAEAKKRGYDILVMDANQDLQTQVNQLEDLIAKKVDLILLSAMDIEGIIPTVQAVNKAGIPIVTYDATPKGGDLLATISWDNYDAGNIVGKWAADYIKNSMGGKANIAILTLPLSSQIMSRVQGFKDALKDLPDAKIVAEQDGQTDRAASMAVTENILQSGKKIDLIYGNFDNQSFGAAAALKAAGKQAVVVSAGMWAVEAFKLIEGNDPFFKAGTLVSPYIQASSAFDVIDAHFAGKDVPKLTNITLQAVDGKNIKSIVNWQDVEAKRAELTGK